MILFHPVLHSANLFDLDQLLSNIHSAYSSDSLASLQLSKLSTSDFSVRWSLSKDLLLLNSRIYIPDHSDLHLHILHHRHDHILSGHLGQNKTIGLV